MSHKPKIAFDLDDVIVESTESWRQYVNSLTGSTIPADRFKSPGSYWDYYENVWQQHGVREKFSIRQLDTILESSQDHMVVYDGAGAALATLKATFDLAVITARDTAQENATREWLDLNLPAVFEEVIFAAGQLSDASKSKADICKEINAQWLVDDNPQHCVDAQKAGVQAILFGDFGWQAGAPDHLIRCSGRAELEEYFRGLDRA